MRSQGACPASRSAPASRDGLAGVRFRSRSGRRLHDASGGRRCRCQVMAGSGQVRIEAKRGVEIAGCVGTIAQHQRTPPRRPVRRCPAHGRRRSAGRPSLAPARAPHCRTQSSASCRIALRKPAERQAAHHHPLLRLVPMHNMPRDRFCLPGRPRPNEASGPDAVPPIFSSALKGRYRSPKVPGRAGNIGNVGTRDSETRKLLCDAQWPSILPTFSFGSADRRKYSCHRKEDFHV